MVRTLTLLGNPPIYWMTLVGVSYTKRDDGLAAIPFSVNIHLTVL